MSGTLECLSLSRAADCRVPGIAGMIYFLPGNATINFSRVTGVLSFMMHFTFYVDVQLKKASSVMNFQLSQTTPTHYSKRRRIFWREGNIGRGIFCGWIVNQVKHMYRGNHSTAASNLLLFASFEECKLNSSTKCTCKAHLPPLDVISSFAHRFDDFDDRLWNLERTSLCKAKDRVLQCFIHGLVKTGFHCISSWDRINVLLLFLL